MSSESQLKQMVNKIGSSTFAKLRDTVNIARSLPSTKSTRNWDASAQQAFAQRRTDVCTQVHRIMANLLPKVGGIDGQMAPIEVCATPGAYQLISDSTDRLLERVDMSLDQSAALNKQSKVLATNQGATRSKARSGYQRPQFAFATPPDNSNEPFVPLLTSKPNAIEPLNIGFEMDSPSNHKSYCHPYKAEINSFEYQPHQLAHREPKRYPPIGDTEPTWVDSVELLEEMNHHLGSRDVCEVAIDLEHHSYRSFRGFVCLMQVSTRHRDFLVDTLVLREELQRCNEWTTDPKIVKVLHGADRDVLWLQSNFGIYIVNMFDTGIAAKQLSFPSKGLAHLLKKYCGVIAAKQYQLADWRLRPLPKEMVAYAQADTHYLLFVYDKLTNELKQKSTVPVHNPSNEIKAVLDQSRDLCLKKYEKPRYTETSYQIVLSRRNQVLSPLHERIFAQLFKWRDSIARKEDESTGYVLPTDAMLQLATKAPSNMAGLIDALNILRPLVRRHAKEILRLIDEAKKAPTPAQPTETPQFAARGRKGQNKPTRIAKSLFTPMERVAAAADVTKKGIENSITPSVGKVVGTPAATMAVADTPEPSSDDGSSGRSSASSTGRRPSPWAQDELFSSMGWNVDPSNVSEDPHNAGGDASKPLASSLPLQKIGALGDNNLGPHTIGPQFLSHEESQQFWKQTRKEMQLLAKSQTYRVQSSGSPTGEDVDSTSQEHPFPFADVSRASSGSSTPRDHGDESNGIAEGKIPTTMDGIFVLSNRNRRLLKQSEKSTDLREAGKSSNAKAKKITPTYETKEEIAFMKDINWVPEETDETDLGVRPHSVPMHKKARISGTSPRQTDKDASSGGGSGGGGGSSSGSGGGRSKGAKQGKQHRKNKSGTSKEFVPYDYRAATEATGAAHNPYVAKTYASQHRSNVQSRAGTYHAGKTRRGHLTRGGRGRGRGNRGNNNSKGGNRRSNS